MLIASFTLWYTLLTEMKEHADGDCKEEMTRGGLTFLDCSLEDQARVGFRAMIATSL